MDWLGVLRPQTCSFYTTVPTVQCTRTLLGLNESEAFAKTLLLCPKLDNCAFTVDLERVSASRHPTISDTRINPAIGYI